MLDKVDLNRKMTKEAFKSAIKPLRIKLSELQHQIKNEKIPVIILFEGWGTSGKGSILSDVILTLDPRNFKTKNTLPPTPAEQREAFLWRHWNSLAERGILGIYDRSWYPDAVSPFARGEVDHREMQRRIREINTFERQLSDDGTVILKFFLHITQKEQKKRLDRLASKKSTAWRVDEHDYQNNKNYKKLYSLYNEALAATNSEYAPWHLVSSMDRHSATAEIYQVIVDGLQSALDAREKTESVPKEKLAPKPAASPTPGDFPLIRMPTLAEISLNKSLEQAEYKARLKTLRKQMRKLHNEIYLKKIPVIIAYEGWDAAGKGGNIKRLTSALDPRGYEVVPIAAPNPSEQAHHYLWRFWRSLQKNGHITLFDRSWYGRVLVERVEGLIQEDELQRAYREINEFEASLSQWGAVILKFWLHIDKDEQLVRFKSREDVPDKRWKITDEDWRNREKWNEYEVAINDMIRLTSTDFAPWTIVESQNKLYGRIKTIETLIEAVKTRL